MKREIRAWTDLMEAVSGGGGPGLGYASLAQLASDLARAANSLAIVYNDPTPANNGLYQKVGGSGSGSWTRIGDLPGTLIPLTVAGGTGDAIVATAPETPQVPGRKLYLLTPTANNTGAAMTIVINGAAATPIKNALNSTPAANTFVANVGSLLFWSVDHYQALISLPVDTAGVVADATAARDAAAASASAAAGSEAALGNQVHQYDTRAQAAGATIPVGVQAIKVTRYAAGYPLSYATYVPGASGGPMAFQEGAGNWWQLDLSGPVIDSAWFGVLGDGSDQTIALQATVDAVPLKGGTVLVSGDILISSLNLLGRALIRFVGKGGWGAGADQATTIHTAAGAGVARVIDARDTIGITFENIKLASTNPAHDGYLLDNGQSTLTSFSQTMSMGKCVVIYNGSAAAINLYGALTTEFQKCLFGGDGTAIAFQNVARSGGLIFSNVHNFKDCNFTPSGTAFPVLGSGEKISFIGCNVQASTADGSGRFWNTSTVVPFIAVNIIDCGFYDVTAAGQVWGSFYAGNGLNIIGNRVGGADPSLGGNYGFSIGGQLTGVQGFSVIGNDAQFMTALLNFDGTTGAGTNASKGFVGGNSLRGGATALFSNLSSAVEVMIAPNYIAAGGKGSHFSIQGVPTSSVGLSTGDWYSNSGVVTIN
ncbi:hypothetical protein [Bradyrhizobium macuxiense]|uniref:hypothetical protein n=1 Tax=Bradyrhizobium macuxiense TaxID=1755647 RepID=UPI0010A963FE|nr:hypothetical protein [Bradyrhizobium macuxiense]